MDDADWDIANGDAPATIDGTGTTLRFRRQFAASPERVFAAWTRPQALSLWWCPAGWEAVDFTVDLRPGGRYRLEMRRIDGSRRVAVQGQFEAIEPPLRLIYTWHWVGAFPDMPLTQVRVRFHPTPGGTELELEQEPLALPLCARHTSGWLHACQRLNRMLERQPHRNTATADSVQE